MKAAVLLTTHNGSDWLSEQINSIISQQDISFDIYVSDDQSADNTLKILNDYAKFNSNFLVSNQSIRFGNAAQNFFSLIRKVDTHKYDFVAFSDQDDQWFTDKLSRAVNSIMSTSNDGYSSNVIAFWDNGKKQLIDKSQPQKSQDYIFESAGPGCTFVITKKLATDIQALLNNAPELCSQVALHDWFIYAFARSRGYKWFIDPIPSMLYRQHANNVVGANTGLKPLISRFKKLKTGWYEQQVMTIAKILGYEHLEPIKRLSRLHLRDRIYLALHSADYRRRFRDQLALAFYFLFIAKKCNTF